MPIPAIVITLNGDSESPAKNATLNAARVPPPLFITSVVISILDDGATWSSESEIDLTRNSGPTAPNLIHWRSKSVSSLASSGIGLASEFETTGNWFPAESQPVI